MQILIMLKYYRPELSALLPKLLPLYVQDGHKISLFLSLQAVSYAQDKALMTCLSKHATIYACVRALEEYAITAVSEVEVVGNSILLELIKKSDKEIHL